MQPLLPGILHIRLVEQDKGRLFIRHSAVMLFGHPGFAAIVHIPCRA